MPKSKREIELDKYRGMLDIVRNTMESNKAESISGASSSAKKISSDINKGERSVDDAANYKAGINRYREIQKMVRTLDSKPKIERKKTVDLLTYLDDFRHSIHLELTELAKKIGKTESDVYLDILGDDENLTEEGLPEFRVMDAKRLLEGMFGGQVGFAGMIGEVNHGKFHNLEGKAFIPFIQEDSWHLFDHDQFFDLRPSSAEARRRMLSFAKDTNGDAIKFEDLTSFHNGVRILGVALDKANVRDGIRMLKEHKNELSTKIDLMDSKVLEADWKEIMQFQIDYIMGYPCGEHETHRQLLEDFKLNFENIRPKITPQQLMEGNVLIDSAIEDELANEIHKEVGAEIDKDTAMSDAYEHLPKRESISGRK